MFSASPEEEGGVVMGGTRAVERAGLMLLADYDVRRKLNPVDLRGIEVIGAMELG